MNSNMEHNQDKVEGNINTLTGTLKEGIGRASGDKNMEAEGTIQKTKGQAQKLKASIQDTIEKGKTLLGIKSKNG